jgi:hypothetical protein
MGLTRFFLVLPLLVVAVGLENQEPLPLMQRVLEVLEEAELVQTALASLPLAQETLRLLSRFKGLTAAHLL